MIGCAVAFPAQAQQFEGARLLSTAGSQRSLVTGNDAIFINPAGLALSKTISVEANAQDDLSGYETMFAGSIVDSLAGPVAGGTSYVYTDRNFGDFNGAGDRKQLTHQFDVSLATKVADTAAIGVTGRWYRLREKVGDVKLEDLGFDKFTVDVGFQWQSQMGLSLGLAAYNLTNPKERQTPISWGGGLGYQREVFSVVADIRYNAQIGKPRFSGAGTLLIADVIPLRFGVSYDRADRAVIVAGGVGYQQGNFGADIGYRHRVVSGDLPADAPRDKMLAFALRALFL